MFNKIKDTIYDRSDIIVALTLIVVAGFIIFNRVDSIMSYPEILAAELAQAETELSDNPTGSPDASGSDQQGTSDPSQQGEQNDPDSDGTPDGANPSTDGQTPAKPDGSEPSGAGNANGTGTSTNPGNVPANNAGGSTNPGNTSNGSSNSTANNGSSGNNTTTNNNNTSGNSGSANGTNSGSSSGSSSGGAFSTSVQRTVTIPSGSTSSTIANILTEAGVVPSKDAFLSAVTAASADTKLKAGTFTIPAGSSVSDVVNIITH